MFFKQLGVCFSLFFKFLRVSGQVFYGASVDHSLDDAYEVGSIINVDDNTELLINLNRIDAKSPFGDFRIKIDSQTSAPGKSSEVFMKIDIIEPGSGDTNYFKILYDGVSVLEIGNEKSQAGIPENLYPETIATTGWRPLADNLYDMGTTDFRWADLYLAGTIKGNSSSAPETLFMDADKGDVRFAAEKFNVSDAGDLDLMGNITLVENIKDESNNMKMFFENEVLIIEG